MVDNGKAFSAPIQILATKHRVVFTSLFLLRIDDRVNVVVRIGGRIDFPMSLQGEIKLK
jgi:hypothetical protein